MRSDMYELHHQLENSHWWFTARRQIVLDVLRREIAEDAGLSPPIRIVDIGCGAGGMLPHLSEFGSVIGVDMAPSAVAYAADSACEVRQGSLPMHMPFSSAEHFDVAMLLDVLEHIDDDREALAAIHRLLRAGGRLIITVPAFQFLWSGHDVVNEHKRRYTRTQLRNRLQRAGFTVKQISYFNTILFVPIAAARLAGRWIHRKDSRSDFVRLPRLLNWFLHSLFAAERHMLSVLRLPFGVSLIAVATTVDT